MKHNVQISVSKKPQKENILDCKNITIREKMMRFLFGKKHKVTILIPGDSVEELLICGKEKGAEQV